jgi:hypothetical protein
MKLPFWIALYALVSTLFISCSENKNDDESVIKQESIDDPSKPFDERVKTWVERKINTRPGENYTLKTYEEDLNDDGKKDVIITVNRLENALLKAKEEGNTNKLAQIGFFGDHNYFIYYSSITNTFSEPVKMTSSPQRELNVTFENISSSSHKDIVVDYTIRNSQFRKIFLVLEDKLIYSFQWKLYDGWGTDQLEAYCFSYDKGSYSEVKDIVIKKGTMKNIEKGADYYSENPSIECTDQLVKRFFFNKQDGKYYTPN